MTAEPIIPDDVEVVRSDLFVTLTFSADGGESRAVKLVRSRLPFFVSKLMKEVESDQVTPIRPDALAAGTSFAIHGWQMAKADDGGRLLTLFVELREPARTVTVPLELSPEDVAALREDLS